MQVFGEREHNGGGDVGGHDDEKCVEAGAFGAFQRFKGCIDIVGKAEVDKVAFAGKIGFEGLLLLHKSFF